VFAPHPHRTFGFHQLDQAAFVSLFSFLFGTTLGHFDGVFGGANKRAWLMVTGITQIIFTIAAAIAANFSGSHVSM
jgi:ABC-type dipeptide/oligopeptide/nickel transport system permease subunit